MTLVLLSDVPAPRVLIDLREWDGRRDDRNTGLGTGYGLLADVGYAAGTTWFSGSGAIGAGGTDGGYVDLVGACHRIISNAGAGGQISRSSPQWSAMLQTDFSVYPPTFTRFRRFTWRIVAEMISAPTNAEYWIGLHDITTPGLLSVGGAGNIGIELVFLLGTNRWGVRSRLTKLGPQIFGAVSDVGVGQRFEFEIQYTEGRVPVVILKINGVILQTFTGLAQFPQSSPLPYVPAGGFPASYGYTIGGGTTVVAVADGELRVRHAQYLVEALAA